jgi:hypothetical protein
MFLETLFFGLINMDLRVGASQLGTATGVERTGVAAIRGQLFLKIPRGQSIALMLAVWRMITAGRNSNADSADRPLTRRLASEIVTEFLLAASMR